MTLEVGPGCYLAGVMEVDPHAEPLAVHEPVWSCEETARLVAIRLAGFAAD